MVDRDELENNWGTTLVESPRPAFCTHNDLDELIRTVITGFKLLCLEKCGTAANETAVGVVTDYDYSK